MQLIWWAAPQGAGDLADVNDMLADVPYAGLLLDVGQVGDNLIGSVRLGCTTYLFGSLAATATDTAAGAVGAEMTRNGSVEVTGGFAPYTFALASGSTLPAGLSIDAATGSIVGTATAGGSGSVTLDVSDAVGLVTTVDLTYTILATTASSVAVTGQVGVPLAPQLTFTTTGGTTPYMYSIANGALPAGLTMAADGTVSGTPTSTANSIVQFMVTDSGDLSTYATVAFTITAAAPPTTAAPTTPPVTTEPVPPTTAPTSAAVPRVTSSPSSMAPTGTSGLPVLSAVAGGIAALGGLAAFIAYRRRSALTE